METENGTVPSRYPITILVLTAVLTLAGSKLSASQAPVTPAPAPPPISEDAYKPLQLYNGAWDLQTSGAGTGSAPMHIVNHCARTGLYYVCEQVINGKSEDLVVFLPRGVSGNAQTYYTEGLSASGEAPGDWGKLEIQGERWVYSSEDSEKGSKEFWRTINVFSGPDKIHFEIQHSTDGKTWESKRSGDEIRVSK